MCCWARVKGGREEGAGRQVVLQAQVKGKEAGCRQTAAGWFWAQVREEKGGCRQTSGGGRAQHAGYNKGKEVTVRQDRR